MTDMMSLESVSSQAPPGPNNGAAVANVQNRDDDYRKRILLSKMVRFHCSSKMPL